ncbi:UNVERIFIED_CONTAM: hypothetical protein K2H54_047562 [Gekko kuhli]
MGLAKLCGFLATSVLLLILLVDSTAEGGLIVPPEPCAYPFVIKGTYKTAFNDNEEMNFEITKVIKAPTHLKNVVKVRNHRSCHPPPEDVKVKEYIVVGYMFSNVIACIENFAMHEERPNETEVFQDISNNGC